MGDSTGNTTPDTLTLGYDKLMRVSEVALCVPLNVADQVDGESQHAGGCASTNLFALLFE